MFHFFKKKNYGKTSAIIPYDSEEPLKLWPTDLAVPVRALLRAEIFPVLNEIPVTQNAVHPDVQPYVLPEMAEDDFR